MPQFTMASSIVAYSLYSKVNAADPQVQASVAGLQVQVPAAAVVAANAGVIVKIGRPDSRTAPTTISNAEVVLLEGESYVWPNTDNNDISLQEKWINASANNAQVYVSIVQA